MALGIRAKEIMTKRIVTIDLEKTVWEAAKRMTKHRIGSIIVLKGKNPIGIITETDLNKRVVALAKNPKKLKVKEIMSSPLVFINPNDDVSEIVKKMEKHKIRRFPVLSEGRIVGIVTHTDIARTCPTKLDILTTRLKMRQFAPTIVESSTSGICEVCGNYSEDLRFINDQWVCEGCRD